MANDGAIFGNEVPMPKGKGPKPAKEVAKPKRQYRKKSEVKLTPELIEKSIKDMPEVIVPITEERFSSFGIEYIQALTLLLELLQETSRERLVQFIIDAKIV